MDDHGLADGLRSREPGALAAVYDAYAGRLYAYCWFRLLSHDATQTALEDTFIVARARIDQLRDRGRLGPWLYAIARLECGRQAPGLGRRSDVPVVESGQPDADRRITAWRAVMALPPLSREVLDLRFRHRLSVPGLALVMGLPVTQAESIVDRSRAELEAAVAAEILAYPVGGQSGCAGRAEILRDRRGALTADQRAGLLRHARECQTCGTRRPRTVSMVKVYDLLPTVAPPASLRPRVLHGFLDPKQISHRLSVVTRAGPFAASGFPAQPRRVSRGRHPGAGHLAGEELGPAGGYRIMLGVAAALAFMIGLSLVPWFIGSDGREAGPARSPATSSWPDRAGRPAAPITRAPSVGRAVAAVSPAAAPFPLGTRPPAPPPRLMTVPRPAKWGPGPENPWQPAPPPDEGPPPGDPFPSAPPQGPGSPSSPPASQSPTGSPTASPTASPSGSPSPPASPSSSASPSSTPSPSAPASSALPPAPTSGSTGD